MGDYTAGAIASIAFGIPVPAVDGNVLRVVSRLLARREDILDAKVKKRVETEITGIIPKGRAGDFNQSLMELGAMVCLPNGAPKCGNCPLEAICLAHGAGIQGELPVKAPKKPRKAEKRTVFLLTCWGRLALNRRLEKGLLAGLWELPGVQGTLSAKEAEAVLKDWGLKPAGKPEQLPAAKHIFTHVEWHMTGWAFETAEPAPAFHWADARELSQELSLPSAFQAYFPEMEKRLK